MVCPSGRTIFFCPSEAGERTGTVLTPAPVIINYLYV